MKLGKLIEELNKIRECPSYEDIEVVVWSWDIGERPVDEITVDENENGEPAVIISYNCHAT